MEKLSAVIISFNEEKNIERCIRSLDGVADEIVVFDSGSTDRTREICEKYGVTFFIHPFDGYIEQKNRALSHARFPLVLSLDADEALSDTLKASILSVKKQRHADGYTMNRLTNYCGRWIRHCGWYPDKKLRLFDKRKGRWGGVNPHDRFEMEKGAVIHHLQGDILHYSYYSVRQHVLQMENFSTIAAQAKFKQGERACFFKTWLSPVFKFIKCYVLRRGFMEGPEGWKICTLSAGESYKKYRKLSTLHHQKKNEHRIKAS